MLGPQCWINCNHHRFIKLGFSSESVASDSFNSFSASPGETFDSFRVKGPLNVLCLDFAGRISTALFERDFFVELRKSKIRSLKTNHSNDAGSSILMRKAFQVESFKLKV